jgi:hypothetical protein
MKWYFRAHLSKRYSATNLFPLLPGVLSLVASGALLCAQIKATSASSSGAPFAGIWKGVCQEGKAFILLDLKFVSNKIEGSVSLGNVSLGDPGSVKSGTCTVTDAATRDHSTSIKDAVVDGPKLTFDSLPGPQVEIVLTSPDIGKLRFPGTPMETASFEIHKTTF